MLMINIHIFRYVFTFVESASRCWSSCYLYEHPEELTEVEVVPEQSESRTAVLWKDPAAVSWHQETDLQTNRERRESSQVCSPAKCRKKTPHNSANANGDISTALARLPAPAGSLSMHFRWPVACLSRCSFFFQKGERRVAAETEASDCTDLLHHRTTGRAGGSEIKHLKA